MRFTKNWLKISRQVFDEQDRQEAAHREYREREEQEHARKKARCKALGLPDPDEVWNAQIAEFMREWKSDSNNNNKITAARTLQIRTSPRLTLWMFPDEGGPSLPIAVQDEPNPQLGRFARDCPRSSASLTRVSHAS